MRAELDIPEEFPAAVEDAAAAAASAPPRLGPRTDATGVELVTVDPPGSLDLDQAFHVAAGSGGGYRVHYAIADVAAFVTAGDPVDAEARRRGETLYAPDRRVPLHPPVLGEGAASVLPGEDRPALLWRIDIDAEGRQVGVDLRRATVRSRARLDYAGLQQALDAGSAPEAARLLPEVGALRMALAAERGALDLGLPDQEVVPRGDGGWTLELRAPLPVEGWNAQMSLLTGMAAAELMVGAGVGLLRTLPAAPPEAVDRLRAAAAALGVAWPRGAGPAEVVRTVRPGLPTGAAFLESAAELLRGAGYTALGGPATTPADLGSATPADVDSATPADLGHAGVGARYAHVTAPIRRLCDRFASEVCVAVAAGAEVPGWARDALPELPALMAASGQRAARLERAVIDLTEAWLLAHRVGERFPAAVVEVDDRGATVVLDDPPVRARCSGRGLQPGARVVVRLVEADPATRAVRFEPAGAAR